ncbi:MAG: PucR family transcriptional regulator ligand-binding domain-containing protein [Oscillospiraceae bacterium]|nr:PucR family transcriptional regulator ligand-binding domain-containing protein [Oscillospiraceae bacterium]
MGFNVRTLADNKELPGLQIVAGKEAENNLIRNVNVLDNPDTYDWLLPGDFVLTTGYVFKDDEKQQLRLVRELSELACAGLGVKVKRYWDEVPTGMIDLANRCGLPIVRIPLSYTLSQISNYINNEIFIREDTLLQKYFKIHKQLVEYTLSELDLDSIAENTASLVGNPLLIMDSRWSLLASAEHPDNPMPLGNVFNLAKHSRIFSDSFMKQLPRDIENYQKAIKRVYSTNGADVACRILPIRAGVKVYGYLVVWESVKKLRSIEYMALEQAAVVIAQERIKTKRVEESKRMAQRDFLNDLLEGRLEISDATRSLAEVHGLRTDSPYICAVIKLLSVQGRAVEEFFSDIDGCGETQKRIMRVCEEKLAFYGLGCCAFFRFNLIVLLLPAKDMVGYETIRAKIGQEIEQLRGALAEIPQEIRFMIGVGKTCGDITQLHHSFMQAQEALRITHDLANANAICWFEDLLVYHLLGSGTSRQAQEELCASSIGVLIQYDKRNGGDMVETLEVFLQEKGNISNAAKRLYIHRNTMIYRLERIKEILHTDLQDAEKLLEIQLGLKIFRMEGNK